MTDWKLEQREEKAQRQAQQQQEQERQQRVFEGLNGLLGRGREKYADFDQSVFVPKGMEEIFIDSEHGVDMAYYLGTNPQELQRICQLPPARQLIEIGKLEVKVSTPAAKKTTSAPPPPSKITGAAAPVVDPDKLPYAEWVKGREEGKW